MVARGQEERMRVVISWVKFQFYKIKEVCKWMVALNTNIINAFNTTKLLKLKPDLTYKI